VSRSVRDTAAALDATAGPEVGDPYAAPPAPRSYLAASKRKPKKLRIAFATKRFDAEAFDPECKAATEAAAKLCEKLGHRVEEGMPQVSPEDLRANLRPIWASGLTMLIDSIAKAAGSTPVREEFEGLTWSLYQFGKTNIPPPNTNFAGRTCTTSREKLQHGSNLTTPGLRRCSQRRL
jgi:amidase